MLVNYLKVLFRNLKRNKTFSILNLLGLSAGWIAFILIMLYVKYEHSYDQYHEKKDRVYRVVMQELENYYFGTNYFCVTQAPLAPTLKEEFPIIANAARVWWRSNSIVAVGDQTYFEPKVFGIDGEAFSIFSFEVLAGNQAEFLKDKYTAVLTASTAAKYFGESNPIGQVIQYKKEHPFTVVGVIADMPKNSHFRMDVIVDFETLTTVEDRPLDRWNNSSFYTYIALEEGANASVIEEGMPAFVKKYIDKEDKIETKLILQPLTDIYLKSSANFEIGPTNDGQKLRIYTIVAFLILLIAGINYINLSTAKGFRRAKEVGIRKTIGASRKNLIFQFLGESFALTCVSLALALTIINVSLPSFSAFVGVELSLSTLNQQWLIPFIAISCVSLAFFSGIYPSFVLSSFRPVEVLKSTLLLGNRKSILRNALVVTQFSISAILIISAIIISRQLHFIQEKDLGFSKDQILVVKIRDQKLLEENLSVFKAELAKLPPVKNVASGSSLPNDFTSSSDANWPGKADELNIPLYTAYADHEYLNLFEMEVVEGRKFSKEHGDDEQSMLLNETAVKALGWDNPLGRKMITWRGDTASVVGIIKDFHQHSLHLAISPLQLFLGDYYAEDVVIKIAPEDLAATINSIKSVHDEFSNGYPFEYSFFDEVFAQAYEKDLKTSQMANWFTALIILIACLGLYGLSLFITELRVKEVGIRKVLGASVSSLLFLLSREFLQLIFLAFLIAIPISVYVMNQWLENFAYHISIGFTHFIWTLSAMLFITVLTVGYRTLRAATNNPVEALAQE